MVLGKSGTGKSSSIRNLKPEETVIINILGKKLPFKGGSKLYNKENKNYFQLDTHSDIIALLQNIDSSAPHVQNVIIEDMTYLMRKEYFARAKENGFSKFVEIGQHFQQVVSVCEKMKESTNVFFIMHSEDIVSNGNVVGTKVSTIGKLVDESYNPVEVVPIVLHSKVRYKEDGDIEYGFYTRRVMVGTEEILAKSPADMFLSEFIPNDLQAVVEAMNEYY